MIFKFIQALRVLFLHCVGESTEWKTWLCVARIGPCFYIMSQESNLLPWQLGVSSGLGQVSSSLLFTNTWGGTEGHLLVHSTSSKLHKMRKDSQNVNKVKESLLVKKLTLVEGRGETTGS